MRTKKQWSLQNASITDVVSSESKLRTKGINQVGEVDIILVDLLIIFSETVLRHQTLESMFLAARG